MSVHVGEFVDVALALDAIEPDLADEQTNAALVPLVKEAADAHA